MKKLKLNIPASIAEALITTIENLISRAPEFTDLDDKLLLCNLNDLCVYLKRRLALAQLTYKLTLLPHWAIALSIVYNSGLFAAKDKYYANFLHMLRNETDKSY